MNNYIEIKGIKIGDGIPKICVPIVGQSEDDILKSAKEIKKVKHDLVEWRVDYFKNATSPDRVNAVIASLNTILEDTPILFTFRTRAEGGEMDLSKEEYLQINLEAIKNGGIDLIDVELFTGEDSVKTIIEEAHTKNIKVVVSNHDFERTPSKKELVTRMQRMQNLGADIPKMAVMPVDKSDVLTLLSATDEMYSNYANRPIVTMSMGRNGVISRICGEFFGSAITFGSVTESSAPGQIPAAELSELLTILHNYS